jgi:predicted transcriptional regulator
MNAVKHVEDIDRIEERRRLFCVTTESKVKELLEFLRDHGRAHYKDMEAVACAGTLNFRRITLLEHGLIHFYENPKTKIKIYEITKKGERILHLLEEIEGLGVDEVNALKVMRSKFTTALLLFIKAHRQTQYTDMMELFKPHTLNAKLHEFCALELVEYHLKRVNARKGWYEITEKGIKALELFDEIVKELK